MYLPISIALFNVKREKNSRVERFADFRFADFSQGEGEFFDISFIFKNSIDWKTFILRLTSKREVKEKNWNKFAEIFEIA